MEADDATGLIRYEWGPFGALFLIETNRQVGERVGATQIIYEAWKRTGTPEYHTRDGSGNDIVIACEFLNPMEHLAYDAAWVGVCMVCGAETEGGIPHKKMLGDTYTDWGIHKMPESSHICKACAFCLLLNPAKGRIALKNYSYIAADRLYICNRAEMRDWLVDPPEPPFVAVVTISQKKHLATKAAVSYRRERYACMLEEERIYVDLAAMQNCMRLVEALRGIGMTKTDIETRRIKYSLVKRWNTGQMVETVKRLNEHDKTRILPLALHVAQKMEEEEAICYLGLTPRTVA